MININFHYAAKKDFYVENLAETKKNETCLLNGRLQYLELYCESFPTEDNIVYAKNDGTFYSKKVTCIKGDEQSEESNARYSKTLKVDLNSIFNGDLRISARVQVELAKSMNMSFTVSLNPVYINTRSVKEGELELAFCPQRKSLVANIFLY